MAGKNRRAKNYRNILRAFNNTFDSRYWGAVPRKLIYGKFWRRYYQAEQGE
jgi:type IV secretory pathway protease TraF